MTYTQQQRRRISAAYDMAARLRTEAQMADEFTRAELMDSADDWERHAERLANKLHARRNRQGALQPSPSISAAYNRPGWTSRSSHNTDSTGYARYPA